MIGDIITLVVVALAFAPVITLIAERLSRWPARKLTATLKESASRTEATPYRTAAEREAVFVAVKASFKDLVTERRRFELRLKTMRREHSDVCVGRYFYCCRARYHITLVMDRWDNGKIPSGPELVAAEAFMSEKE
jgi:hypothetical protein